METWGKKGGQKRRLTFYKKVGGGGTEKGRIEQGVVRGGKNYVLVKKYFFLAGAAIL